MNFNKNTINGCIKFSTFPRIFTRMHDYIIIDNCFHPIKLFDMKKYFFFLALLPCLSACMDMKLAAVNLPSRFNDNAIQTMQYDSKNALNLDIYTPTQVTANTNVVIFFYGGRWETGEKSDYRFMGALLADHGYIAVLPDYRKYPRVHFPAFVQDGAAAVAWVAAHYPGRRIHIAGHSAGAHIGALIAADHSYLKKYNLDPDLTITDFIGLAGPYDFTPAGDDLEKIFGPPANYPRMQVPTFITGHEPPMLLMWGEDDKDVAAYNLGRLAGKIHAAGGDMAVKIYPGVDHAGMMKAFTWVEPDSPVRRDFFDYLEAHQ